MSRYKILYAEDHRLTAEYTSYELEQKECDVTVFNNGDDAWRAYLAAPNYDLVLLDYQMPGKNGLELYNLIRQHDENIPILIISAYVELSVRSLQMGVDDFVRKDASIEELVARIDKAIKIKQSNKIVDKKQYLTLETIFITDKRELFVMGKQRLLSNIEAEIITLLSNNRNNFISSEIICKAIWNNSVQEKGRQLQNYISKIRKIVEQDPRISIVNDYGRGYCLKIR